MSQPNTTFQASAERRPGGVHVLLIATGSVASIKVPLIVAEILKVRNTLVQPA